MEQGLGAQTIQCPEAWAQRDFHLEQVLTKTIITLGSDFRSSSGPDLYVYVGNGKPSKRIAKLKKFKGSQTYSFSGTDKITSVHVYCKRFSVGFGTAKLN